MAFKICVIGCGGIAVRGHGPAYQLYRQTYEGTELAGCCDIDAQRAAHFRERFGFRRAYTDYAEMLAQERPDAVCLVVPVEKTAGLAVSIMKRGYPLLMEKPPGIDLCEAELLANTAESCGVPNMVAFNRRHVPLVRILRERMADCGIRHIQCEFCRVGRYDKDFTTTAVHGIDTVGLLAGAPYKEVRIGYQPLSREGELLNFFLDCAFENEVTAHLAFCPATGADLERITLHGPEDSFFLNIPVPYGADRLGGLVHLRRGASCFVSEPPKEAWMQEEFYLSGFYHECEGFFEAVRHGNRPADDVRSCLQTVRIGQAMRQRKASVVF